MKPDQNPLAIGWIGHFGANVIEHAVMDLKPGYETARVDTLEMSDVRAHLQKAYTVRRKHAETVLIQNGHFKLMAPRRRNFCDLRPIVLASQLSTFRSVST
jgi:hypothetical protein